MIQEFWDRRDFLAGLDREPYVSQKLANRQTLRSLYDDVLAVEMAWA